ncbi:MAG: PAS domain-containing protein, partial [Gillisia sp.]
MCEFPGAILFYVLMMNPILKASNELVTNHPLLIFTDIETLEIKFANPAVEKFLGSTLNDAKKIIPQFEKRFIHPDDCCTYTDFIKSLKGSSEDEVKEIELRLRSKEQEYKSFRFFTRRYNFRFDNENPMAISLIFPACTAKKIPEDQENDYRELKKEYQHLLESLDEAFCVVEMIFNKENEPVDYLFIKTNTAFEEQINLKNVVGKTMRELIPDHEDDWFKIYGKVAKTGEALRFKFQGKKLNNAWLDLYAFKLAEPTGNQVGVIFKNISEQVQLDQELKQAKAALEKKASQREKELKESNALLQTVFDTTKLGIAVFRIISNNNGEAEDFEYVRINEVLREMSSNKNILGKRYSETTSYGVE